MGTAELVQQVTAHVKDVERMQEMIHKARSASAKFSAAVVEKVVKDNTAKCNEVAVKVAPLTSEMTSRIDGLKAKRDGVIVGSQEAKFTLQELELRHLVGEYDGDAFAGLAAEPQATVAAADAQVTDLEGEVSALEAALAAWAEIAGRSGLA